MSWIPLMYFLRKIQVKFHFWFYIVIIIPTTYPGKHPFYFNCIALPSNWLIEKCFQHRCVNDDINCNDHFEVMRSYLNHFITFLFNFLFNLTLQQLQKHLWKLFIWNKFIFKDVVHIRFYWKGNTVLVVLLIWTLSKIGFLFLSTLKKLLLLVVFINQR